MRDHLHDAAFRPIVCFEASNRVATNVGDGSLCTGLDYEWFGWLTVAAHLVKRPSAAVRYMLIVSTTLVQNRIAQSASWTAVSLDIYRKVIADEFDMTPHHVAS